MGRQVVLASDEHPKMIEEFGESLINRFVSGMVVRIDPPNYITRCEILRSLALRGCYNTRTLGEVDGTMGVTMDLGFGFHTFTVDYAFVPIGTLENTHRISISYKF